MGDFHGAWERLVGLPADRIGRQVEIYYDLVHPEDRPRFLAAAAAGRAGKVDEFAVEYRLRRPDGSYIWVEARGHVRRRGAGGEVLELAGQCIDISDRKAVEAERDRAVDLLRHAIDALPDGFVIFDEADRILMWNRRLEELFPPEIRQDWRAAITFEAKMRLGIEAGLYPEALGREEEWLAGLLAARATGDSEFEVVRADGKVIRYRDRLLANGHRVATRADLTHLREAEAQARAADARLAAAVELMPDGFVVLDASDRYVLVNRRMLDLYPLWSREEVIGRSAREVLEREVAAGIYPAAVGREAAWIDEMMAERDRGELFLREERLASGRWLRHVERRLDSGERIGLRIDITRLKVAAARLQAILDGSGHAAWEWEIAGGTMTMGAPWFAALGRDPNAFPGTPAGFVAGADPGDVAELERRTRDHLAGRSARLDATLRYPLPDRVVWFQVRGRVIERDRGGRALKLAGVVIDVTEDRALRERLEGALAAAERASRAQVDLMARMSHDIRTPLNGVLGTVSLLGSMVADADQRRLLDVAARSGEHLIALIDEILDLARIETGRITLAPAPLRLTELAEQVRAAHGRVAEAKGIDFEVFCDAGAARPRIGDGNRILEVLHNLVGNAVKFTEQGGVEVRIRAPERAPVRIEVQDSGPGMSPEEAERLFEPFVQASPEIADRYGGFGLGLAIVRRLVDLMAGTLTVDSSPGRGTAMTVVLPLPAAGAADQRR